MAPGIVKTPDALEPAADGNVQLAILRSWSVLTLRSRMLAVIDVSGSMADPTESGLRRIDIFQQAAIGALQKFSGEVEMGVWDFSTNRVGAQDWEDLTPVAPLGDAQHAQDINNIIASLPARLGGATGLYDTTLAAVQRVQESYDPSKVNSVLLITDGRNEDDNGISLDDLLAKLQAASRPEEARAGDLHRLRSRHRPGCHDAHRQGDRWRGVLGDPAGGPRQRARRCTLAAQLSAELLLSAPLPGG